MREGVGVIEGVGCWGGEIPAASAGMTDLTRAGMAGRFCAGAVGLALHGCGGADFAWVRWGWFCAGVADRFCAGEVGGDDAAAGGVRGGLALMGAAAYLVEGVWRGQVW